MGVAVAPETPETPSKATIPPVREGDDRGRCRI